MLINEIFAVAIEQCLKPVFAKDHEHEDRNRKESSCLLANGIVDHLEHPDYRDVEEFIGRQKLSLIHQALVALTLKSELNRAYLERPEELFQIHPNYRPPSSLRD